MQACMNPRKEKRNRIIVGFIEVHACSVPIDLNEFVKQFNEKGKQQYEFKSAKSAAQILKDISAVNKNIVFDTKPAVSRIFYNKQLL